ncbi:MAG: hypothetical protein M3N47_01635 [Chloroflexota bacterium]|nr:hypothetical protein [Chloroflexota bacterium]
MTLEQGSAHIRQYIEDRSGRELTLEGGVDFAAGTAAGTIFNPIVSDGRFIVIYPTMYLEDDRDTWQGGEHVDAPGMVGSHPRAALDMLRAARCSTGQLPAGRPCALELNTDAARQRISQDAAEALRAHISSFGRRAPDVTVWLDEDDRLIRIDFARRGGLTTSVELSDFGTPVDANPPAAAALVQPRGPRLISAIRAAFRGRAP